ncbi:MAG: hypothetical protein ACREB3_11590, partial [Burkholderiales bacterium]
MIHIFSHYVQGRLIVLAALEVLVLLNAAFIGISLHIAGSGAAIPGAGAAVPPQAMAFALCMMVVISSMGLYQPDLWNNNKSIGVRLAAAFLLLPVSELIAGAQLLDARRRIGGGELAFARRTATDLA